MEKIGFIGCGHMGEAMLSGLLKAQWTSSDHVMVSTKTLAKSKQLKKIYNVQIAHSNLEVATFAQIIVLAVKPNLYQEVIEEIKPALQSDTMLISITPSFSLALLSRLVDHRCHVVRTMPNTPSMVGFGMTGIAFLEAESQDTKNLILSLCRSFGDVVEVEESHMKIIGTLSGSGPAFVDVFMKALIDYGIQQGLDEKTARTIVLQTFVGAALLAKSSNESLDTLISNVCSPGGSTIEGVHALEEADIDQQIKAAIHQTTERFVAMSREIDTQIHG